MKTDSMTRRVPGSLYIFVLTQTLPTIKCVSIWGRLFCHPETCTVLVFPITGFKLSQAHSLWQQSITYVNYLHIQTLISSCLHGSYSEVVRTAGWLPEILWNATFCWFYSLPTKCFFNPFTCRQQPHAEPSGNSQNAPSSSQNMQEGERANIKILLCAVQNMIATWVVMMVAIITYLGTKAGEGKMKLHKKVYAVW